MRCPVCKNPMVILELQQIEIDYCTFCQGIWLDAGELEALLGDTQQVQDLLTSFKIDDAIREKRIKCPICNKKMHKIQAGQHNPIIIDKCRIDHGLWFDSGELQQIIEMGSLHKENEILILLKDIFTNKLK
ncbi:MAG: zf-TFIIB domain-containing protein [Bacteroidetes bacterium]|nr:zf-TFIIB domain-containing protein [Bacteroidota bacterium]